MSEIARLARGVACRAAQLPGMARPAAAAKRMLAGRDPDGLYGASYFKGGRNGRSGYERYDRIMSNSDFAAFIIWRNFDVEQTLEVGAAMGYLVESLRELDIEAYGVDVSKFAVENSSPAARSYMSQVDLRGNIPVEDSSYDMVIALETLEHLPPEGVPAAVKEISRATKGWVYVTIPSFGHNEFGPDGFYSGKVKFDRLAHYESLPAEYQGPIPYDDLLRDDGGAPIQGHIAIASFSWWTDRFAEAGLERSGEMERRIHRDIAHFGFTNLWDAYVFCEPGTPLPPEDLRTDDEARALEERWGLMDRRPGPRC